ncbi:MAG: sporulation integral membrane protein YtvI [Hydrogenoanaerobacterium sp.]
MNREQKLNFLLNSATAVVFTALALIILKYLLWWFLPLFLGLLISFILRPLVNAAYKLSSATRRFCAAAVLLFVYGTLATILWLCIVQLTAGLRGVFINLPYFLNETLAPVLWQLSKQFLGFLQRFLPEIGSEFEVFIGLAAEQLSVVAASASEKLIAAIGTFIRGIPTFMLTFLFTVLSSFFISMDYSGVINFLIRLIPKRHRKAVFVIKDFFVSTIFKYIRAYSVLLLLTFAEVWVGLALLKVPQSLWWAVLVAAADILPAIGTGLILLPWALLAFLQGNSFLSVGILTLYGIITVVRNIAEPKIVGESIGLSPLVTITAMFLGLKILGIAGLLVVPLLVLFVKFLNDSGKLHLWE